MSYDGPTLGEIAFNNQGDIRRKVEALERKVAAFEAMVRAFAEMPIIWTSPSLRPHLKAMGYEFYEIPAKDPGGRPSIGMRRKAA